MPLRILTALRENININCVEFNNVSLEKKKRKTPSAPECFHCVRCNIWMEMNCHSLVEENYSVKIQVHVKCCWRMGTENERGADHTLITLRELLDLFLISTYWSCKQWRGRSLSTAYYKWLIFFINTRSCGVLKTAFVVVVVPAFMYLLHIVN